MNILSIDGGGIRGIIPGQVLVELEKKIQKKDPTKRIADVFDMVAGTSTGGILTCLYLCPDANGKPRFSARDAVNLYLQNGDKIFDDSLFREMATVEGLAGAKYSADALETILKNYLGDLKLSQLLKPCLITSYDITRRQAKFFNQADITTPPADPGADFFLRDVARATSAAPTYFEPANIRSADLQVYPLVDGGVFANNPTMCACVEAFGYDAKLAVTDLKVLSLGTGAAELPYHYAGAQKWGKLQWLGPILDILMSGVSETVDYQMQTIFKSAGCPSQYLRVQAKLAKYPDVDPAMDNASGKNMQALEAAGNSLAAQFDKQLDDFVKFLF